MKGKQIRSILVIKLRNIGDVLLSSALFDNLRAAYPGARISALVNAGTQEMLSGHPAVDQVIVFDRGLVKGKPLLARLRYEMAFYRRVRAEHFDLVLNLTEGDRGALLALASGAPVRVGLDAVRPTRFGKHRIYTHLLPPYNPAHHSVEKNLQFLEPLGVPMRHHAVSFHFSTADRERVHARLTAEGVAPGRYFHAHVTSRWMFKTLPLPKAAFLIDTMAELSGLPAVLTCAPEQKELDYLAALMPLLKRPYQDWSGALTLKQLGALSASARFFVGVDSAPMHMAAALDIPVLALFGPSSVPEWGPWDNALSANPYTQRNGEQRAGRHIVLQSALPCVPCHRDGCNGSKKSDCLDYPEEQLAQAARDFLARI